MLVVEGAQEIATEGAKSIAWLRDHFDHLINQGGWGEALVHMLIGAILTRIVILRSFRFYRRIR